MWALGGSTRLSPVPAFPSPGSAAGRAAMTATLSSSRLTHATSNVVFATFVVPAQVTNNYMSESDN